LIPFAFFALLTNDNSHVEIIVENVATFNIKYKNEIAMLREINNNFLIRSPIFKTNKHIFNTYRFFEKPTVQSEYTYIADIDIMFLEDNIVEKYESFWPENLPYNNVLRTKTTSRLTGVHMVKTNEYFTNKLIECQKKYYNKNSPINDEVILGDMCKEIFGLPNFNHRNRPIYGIHFSPNRGPKKSMGLCVSKKYYDKFMDIKSEYKQLFEFDIFNNLTKQLTTDFIVNERDPLANIRLP